MAKLDMEARRYLEGRIHDMLNAAINRNERAFVEPAPVFYDYLLKKYPKTEDLFKAAVLSHWDKEFQPGSIQNIQMPDYTRDVTAWKKRKQAHKDSFEKKLDIIKKDVWDEVFLGKGDLSLLKDLEARLSTLAH